MTNYQILDLILLSVHGINIKNKLLLDLCTALWFSTDFYKLRKVKKNKMCTLLRVKRQAKFQRN